MTLKEMFKKVEAYNEIAEMMNTRKAKINFYDVEIYQGNSFETYDDLRKHIRNEYIKEVAEKVLKSDGWEFDKELTIEWTDYFGSNTSKFSADLVAD